MKNNLMRLVAGLAFTSAVGFASYAGGPVLRAQQTQSQDKQPAQATVTIDNFNFTPREITVAPGTTVVWTNQDDVPHTVVSNDNKFKSKALDTDDKFSFTFNDAGSFEYFCSVHPKMTAKVIVKSQN